MKNYPQSILKRDSPLILCCAALFMLLILPLASSQELELISKESVFTSLKSNDAKTGTATFTLANPETIPLQKEDLIISFKEDCGKVASYKIVTTSTCSRQEPIIKTTNNCINELNKTTDKEEEKCTTTEEPTGYNTINYACEKEITNIEGIKDYRIIADLRLGRCKDGSYGYKIDWIPILSTTTKGIITQSDWAWWNTSYTYRQNITNSGTGSNPFSINTSMGWNGLTIYYSPDKTGTTAIYFNDTTNYAIIKNDTTITSFSTSKNGLNNTPENILNETDLFVPFDTNTTAPKDIGAQHYNLTTNTSTYVTGFNVSVYGGAINLDASNNKIIMQEAYKGVANTISFWWKPSIAIIPGATATSVFDDIPTGNPTFMLLSGNAGTLCGANELFSLGDIVNNKANCLTGVLTPSWHLITLQYNSYTWDIWIDGVNQSRFCGTSGCDYGAESNHRYIIGWIDLWGTGNEASGTFDNLLITNRNLTGTEIMEMYNNGAITHNETTGSGATQLNTIENASEPEATPIYQEPIVNFGSGSSITDNYYRYSQNWINILTNTSYMATAKNTTIKIYNNTAPYTNATVSINNTNNFTGLEAGAFKINLTSNYESYSNNKFLSYYMFDENETLPIDIKDYYNMSNNTATLGTGYYGGGLVLDGVSGQTHGTGAYFNGVQQFNICFWAYPLNMSGTYNYAVGNNYVEIYRYNNAWRLAATNLTDTSISHNIGISWNAWNFVCGGWNGTHIYACKNGVCNYEASTGYLNTGSLPLYIGNDGDSVRYFFNGTIDEVMIFNRSLSQAEIYEAYNMPPGINSAETRSINIYEHDNLTISSPTGINSRQININYTEARIKPSGTNISINNYTLMLYKEAVYNRTITARGNVSTGYFYNISNDATLTHGDYSIKIITSDTKGNNNSNTQSFTLNNTIPNNPTSLTTNTTAFYYGTSTSMTGTGSTDIDAGDTITYYYQVTNLNDSATVQEYSTSNSYMPSLTDVGDTLMIKVKSSDGIDYSTGWVTKNMTVYLSYNGFGIMREKTNTPLDLATLDELSMSIICEDDVQIINVTNTTYMPINISCAYEYIKIDATYDNTSYFRIISPSYTPYANFTAYMLDLNYDVGVEIIIQIIDLTGDYQNGMMTIKRYFNSTQVDIISQPFDIESKATLYLLKDMLYTVTITNDDGEEQNIGNLIASSPGEKTLTLPAITFYPGTNLGDDLVWNYTYNAGVISLIYHDEDYNIINATFTISYENSTTLYSSTSTNNHSSTFTYAVPNTNLTYKSNLTIWHRTLGRMFEQKVYMGKTNVISDGEGSEFENIEQWKFWIAMVVIIFVGLLFGARESKIGLVVVDIFYMMFAAWEWINFGAITWLIFGIMVVLTILNFISKSKEAAE